jgi:hypothetical protein
MNLFALTRDLGLLTFAGLWLGSALWLHLDATARLERPARARLLVVGGLAVPFLVPLLYACLRPAESRAQRRERVLVTRVLAAEAHAGERCLACRTPVAPTFLRCPGCGDELRRPCPACRAPLRLHWAACPHCEHEVAPPVGRLRVAA